MKKIIIIALMSIISINVFGQQHLPDTIVVGNIKLERNESYPFENPEYVRYIAYLGLYWEDIKYLESNGFERKMEKQLKKMGYVVGDVELNRTVVRYTYISMDDWNDNDYLNVYHRNKIRDNDRRNAFSGVEVTLVDEAVRKENRELARKSEIARKNRLDNIMESIR